MLGMQWLLQCQHVSSQLSFIFLLSSVREVKAQNWNLCFDCFKKDAPVVSEGGWLSTGNTVMCRSYTGRLSRSWVLPLVPVGIPSLQHIAELSVSPSEITKVMVSWRGVSPISSPKTTIPESALKDSLYWVLLVHLCNILTIAYMYHVQVLCKKIHLEEYE